MVDLVDDRKAPTHLLDKVLVLDEDAPIVLALEKAGVQRASDFVSLQLTPDTPHKYDHPAEGSDKAKKNVPLLVAETRQLMGLQEYIRYHAKNVSHKVYESIDDWEKLTAKDFVLFRISIAPTLPPDAAPSAAPTQPPPVIDDPLKDWKKGIKRDMSIFKELKRVKDWDQWDTQFRADVATQGLSRVLDNTFVPKTMRIGHSSSNSNTICMLSLSEHLRLTKGRLLSANTRAPLMLKVFTMTSKSMPPTPPRPSLTLILYCSTSQLHA